MGRGFENREIVIICKFINDIMKELENEKENNCNGHIIVNDDYYFSDSFIFIEKDK